MSDMDLEGEEWESSDRRAARALDRAVSGAALTRKVTRLERNNRELTRRIEVLQAQLRRGRLGHLFPSNDSFCKEGDLLVIRTRFKGTPKTYHYAAIKALGRYYLTGRGMPQCITYDRLIQEFSKEQILDVKIYHYDGNLGTQIDGLTEVSF
jgi:hypothetical protein